MTGTIGDPTLFDVESEKNRLINNVSELYSLHLLSPTAARKAQEKIQQWARSNAHRQIGTSQ